MFAWFNVRLMKMKTLAGLVLTVALAAGCATEKQADQATLQAEAKISKEAATQAALAQVPNGSVKSAELEKEHGKLIWSFDMATPGTSEITEVNVNAITGQVVSTSKESPESESKEKD